MMTDLTPTIEIPTQLPARVRACCKLYKPWKVNGFRAERTARKDEDRATTAHQRSAQDQRSGK